MGLLLVLAVAVLALAFANGANDNFKGVATLFGSGTTDYKKAITYANGTTFAGSLAAFVLARGLVAAFRVAAADLRFDVEGAHREIRCPKGGGFKVRRASACAPAVVPDTLGCPRTTQRWRNLADAHG